VNNRFFEDSSDYNETLPFEKLQTFNLSQDHNHQDHHKSVNSNHSQLQIKYAKMLEELEDQSVDITVT
jgi:hypothetical protein